MYIYVSPGIYPIHISITGTDSNLIQISISSQMEINGSENIANECVVVVTNWEIIFCNICVLYLVFMSLQFLYVHCIYLYLLMYSMFPELDNNCAKYRFFQLMFLESVFWEIFLKS